MRIKRLRKIRIGSIDFKINWHKAYDGGSFSFLDAEINIGTRFPHLIFETVVHEITEVVLAGMHVRHLRSDCDTDYIFVYDHRQHTSACASIAGLIEQFME